MARREDLEPVQNAMAAALQGLAERGAPGALQTLWAQASGLAAAGASRPVGFVKGRLSVDVDSPAWLLALQDQSAELRRRLSRALPGFVELELQLRPGAR